MTQQVYYFWNFFICFIYLLSLFFSIRLVGNKSIPSYMKNFYWYSIVGALVSICLILTMLKQLKLSTETFRMINTISLIFHFAFLGNLILGTFTNRLTWRVCRYVFFIGTASIIFLIIYNFKKGMFSFSFVISNFILFTFCIIYYYQTLNDIPIIKLLDEPAFWIVTGVFIGMGLSFPPTIFYDFSRQKLSVTEARFLGLASIFPYGIMHLFFIKAYLCSTQIRSR